MAKVWLITGSSRGLGRALAEAVLESGDWLVATARKPEQLSDLVERYGDRVRAVALTQLMRALLFLTKPTDPITYILVTLVLAAVALIASSVPALRAANVDPSLAMRTD